MANETYIKSKLLMHSKLTVFHTEFNIEAVCEVKIWSLPESKEYPFGLKYSLFCVDKVTKKVLVGFDNHFPKGPHVHKGNEEIGYEFFGYERLLNDFWNAVFERGFSI